MIPREKDKRVLIASERENEREAFVDNKREREKERERARVIAKGAAGVSRAGRQGAVRAVQRGGGRGEVVSGAVGRHRGVLFGHPHRHAEQRGPAVLAAKPIHSRLV